jgi:hypothetical protein
LKLINKIKSLISKKTKKQEKIIIAQKECHHCSSRGIYNFNLSITTKSKITKAQEE